MTKGFILVENRPLDINSIVQKHIPFLPNDWGFIHYDQFPINSLTDYNILLTQAEFWEAIPFDKILVIQHDSAFLRAGIEEFMEWDYIGAPLKHIPGHMNGGLSLRSRDKMIEVCQKFKWSPQEGNEDIFFVNNLREIGAKLPNIEAAHRFSTETYGLIGSMGVHALNKWVTPERYEEILNQYKDPTIHQQFERVSVGGDCSQHMGLLRDLASECKHVTEFGVGNTTWAFLEAGTAEVHTYDIEEKECLTKLVKAGVRFHCENVLTANIDRTDLLFIDTYGCYSQLSQELHRHAKNVSKYIVIHDTVSWGHRDETGGWVPRSVAVNYVKSAKDGLIPAIHDFIKGQNDWIVDRHLTNNNGLTVLSKRKVVRKLYTSYYIDKNKDRQAEYDYCLDHNLANPLIDRIYIIADKLYPKMQHRKIVPVIRTERPTYNDFFALINETIGNDEIAMISNTDIHFNSTLKLVSALPDTCLALSRWEGDVLHNERYSQDVWIVQGKVKQGMQGNFYLGIRGCDNRISWEIKNVGYRIINPSLSVQCLHVHTSEVRNYGIECIPRPYHPVEICEYIF